MTDVRAFTRAACAVLTLAAAGCGGASTPTAPLPPQTPTAPAATTTVSYSGIFGSGNFTGTVTMTAVVPVSGGTSLTNMVPIIVDTASGVAKFSGSAPPINLTGTFDTTANRFLLTGGSFKVDVTVNAGVATGSITTAVGSGSVSALSSTESSPATRYCGTYRGTEPGKFLVVVSGGTASGVAAQDGEPDAITLTGSVTGNVVTLGWAWTDGAGGSGAAIGTITGQTISGTWSNTDGHSGTWSGAGC